MERQKCLEDELYSAGLVLLPFIVVAVPLIYFFLAGRDLNRSGCAFQMMFGMYCPGCGGTRALNELLHGHLIRSIWYHPLVPYGAGLYLVFMVTWTAARLRLFGITKGLKFHDKYMYGMLVIVAVNFIIKNVLKLCFSIAL